MHGNSYDIEQSIGVPPKEMIEGADGEIRKMLVESTRGSTTCFSDKSPHCVQNSTSRGNTP